MSEEKVIAKALIKESEKYGAYVSVEVQGENGEAYKKDVTIDSFVNTIAGHTKVYEKTVTYSVCLTDIPPYLNRLTPTLNENGKLIGLEGIFVIPGKKRKMIYAPR